MLAVPRNPKELRSIGDYRVSTKNLHSFGESVSELLLRILAANETRVHVVTFRVKDEASARRKIEANPERYPDFASLHDLLGLRIITHFPDEVDRVAEVIKREFYVNVAASTDKRKTQDPSQFGYASLHYVLRLGSKRRQLAEYQPHKDQEFELQIRTVLQHAWAEIEHDLGYHNPEGIPAVEKRAFARLSGLLEIADEQFQGLRDRLTRFENEVVADVRSSQDGIEIDQVSLAAFVSESPIMRRIIDAAANGREVQGIRSFHRQHLAKTAGSFKRLGISTIDELAALLENWEAGIIVDEHRSHVTDRPYDPTDILDAVNWNLQVHAVGDGREDAVRELKLQDGYRPEKVEETIEMFRRLSDNPNWLKSHQVPETGRPTGK